MVLLIAAVVLLVSLPLMAVGGFLLWRGLSAGGPAGIMAGGAARPRDRILGTWETTITDGPATRMLLDVRAGGQCIISADTPRGVIADPTTWEVESESGDRVRIRFHRSGDAETFEWDVQVVSDDLIRVTSITTPGTPVRDYHRIK